MNTSPIQAIVAALRGGNPAQAERLSRDALEHTSDDTDTLLLLAMSLHFQRRIAEAVEIYRRLTELAPESAVHWNNYATGLLDAGQRDEAEAAWRKAMALDPSDPEPRTQLGQLLIARREYVTARDMLLDAFELDRNSPQIRIHAARACSLSQDFRGAEDLLMPWRQWLPLRDDPLQLELARQLLLLGQAPGAHLLLQEVTTRNPAYVEARILLAKVDERLNRVAESEALLQSLDQANLEEAAAKEITHLRAILALRRNDATTARELLERVGPLHENDYAYYYELARACDKLRDAVAAVQALKQAHVLQVDDLKRVSPASFAPDAKALPAAIRYVSAEQYRTWPQFRAPDSCNSPVFIVGFPRSGTTLLEQMLDAHAGLQSMDENPFFERLAGKLRAHDQRILDDLSVLRQYDCDELRKHYQLMAAEKVQRRWDAQLVDKNPLNMLWLPMIYRLYPAAKFILCVRHPCDVLLSCYMQNFRSSILGAASATLQRLAAAYVEAMACWLQHVEVFAPNVLVSRYEDLVADFEPQTRRIADFLELADAAPMLQFDRRAREKGYIATPSYAQVIEPVNTKGLNRWQRYREYFEPALPILAPMLQHWGYSTDAT